MENEPEERDVMDWLMDDEIKRQCEEVSKDEEEIILKNKRRREGTSAEGTRMHHNALWRRHGQKSRMMAGWFTKMLGEVASMQEYEDTRRN